MANCLLRVGGVLEQGTRPYPKAELLRLISTSAENTTPVERFIEVEPLHHRGIIVEVIHELPEGAIQEIDTIFSLVPYLKAVIVSMRFLIRGEIMPSRLLIEEAMHDMLHVVNSRLAESGVRENPAVTFPSEVENVTRLKKELANFVMMLPLMAAYICSMPRTRDVRLVMIS
jgi:hypothetical protein